MFQNTRPYENILNGYQYRLRTGTRLPVGAVNLSYYYNKALSPQDNVLISDMSKFVIENLEQSVNNELVMYPDQQGILHDGNESFLDSELFEITDKFQDGIPLYYAYKLNFKHYDKVGPNSLGKYEGTSIYLIGINNKPISRNRYKYSVYLKPAGQDLYDVYIYTGFQLKNENIMKCVYNAVMNDDIMPAYEERINPQPYFYDYTLSSDIRDGMRYSQIVLNEVDFITDDREKITVNYKIVTNTNPNTALYSGSAIVINRDSALPHELSKFTGKTMAISTIICKDLCPAQPADTIFIVKFNDNNPNNKYVNLSTDPDGTGYILAETTKDTGPKIDTPDKYSIDGNTIIPAYGVKKKDHRQIKVELPVETGPLENWYPRIRYGRFVKNGLNFTVPEYDRELYSSVYGKPYIDVQNEKPVVLNSKTIKTKFSPLHVVLQDCKIPTNLKVKRRDGYGDLVELLIVSWNYIDGIIEVSDNIKENDDLIVEYTFEEQTYTYRGFIDDNIGDFINIDLNPVQYHSVKMMTNGKYKDIPSYYLFNFTIHFYLRPVIEEGQDCVYHKFGTTAESEVTPESEFDIELARVYVRHNTTVDSIAIRDTRVRGGGIIPEMYDKLRKELEPESDYYWDIGYWDGEPYSENGVVIIKLDRKVLKEYGGKFTPQEVDKVVNKYIAYGVLPIIEYVSTYTKENSVSDSVRLTSEYVNHIDFIPMISVNTFNEVIMPPVTVSSVYESPISCVIIEIIKEDTGEPILRGEIYESLDKLKETDLMILTVEPKIKAPVGMLSVTEIIE